MATRGCCARSTLRRNAEVLAVCFACVALAFTGISPTFSVSIGQRAAGAFELRSVDSPSSAFRSGPESHSSGTPQFVEAAARRLSDVIGIVALLGCLHVCLQYSAARKPSPALHDNERCPSQRLRAVLLSNASSTSSGGFCGLTRHAEKDQRGGIGFRRAVQQAEESDGWTRRDALLEIESEMQSIWEQSHAYEENAPDPASNDPKFFVTFPYPYMNGRLHLGHAFSLLKAEFAARFARLDGKRVLYPFSFHCTGMPIAAAAMKLEKELAANAGEDQAEPVPETVSSSNDQEAQVGVFKGSKSKAVAKTGGMSQYDIMRAMKIDEADIPHFTDPQYWLKYFPPLAIQDLKKLGVSIDWRRSFITTDINPYYDAFIRWQFLKLRAQYLGSGFRPSIYSIATGQPCADHDRADGEGVNPLEYTLIKMKVKEIPKEWADKLGSQDIFLVAATLRPETMYGQTNCFVLPEGEYGFFQMSDGQVFVCTRRSALNMCYQGLGEVGDVGQTEGEPVCLMEVTGQQLVGLPLKAPLTSYDTIHVLPMLTISMQKGTGIVTSVPAEAPDDYACLRDWQTRANWREQYGVKEEWCQPFDVIQILEIPDSEFGAASAPYLCEKLKVGSHKEKDKLEAAKKEAYMKGFYSGVLKVGDFAGQKVVDAKPLIRQSLIDAGEAARYFEPESRVVARSGDECIVALCDQWYLTYGDEDWTQRVRAHVESDLTAFNTAAHNSLARAVNWLGDWACSRTFGLGTKLPWDEKWLIESLSDSTIYMAYYTIAHLLQDGDLEGVGGLPNRVTPEDLTEEVFDYIFLDADMPASSNINAEVLQRMRTEFRYWYPLDLRCSGKDLIQNHLTMSLFNHAAVWEDPKMWPRAFYCNGHVMVDSEKMSKSKGNFLSLEDAIKTYGADATRIACADSGDGLEDANFSREAAGRAIQRLTQWKVWAQDMVAQRPQLRTGEFRLIDDIIMNEISKCVNNAHQAYKDMVFSDALRESLFDMDNLRSQYSILTDGDMHSDVIEQFLQVQVLILSPIAPHFCEDMWRNVLGHETLVVKEAWPTPSESVDPILLQKYTLIQDTFRSFRLELDRLSSPKKKKKGKGEAAESAPQKPTHAVVFVAKSYKAYQQDVLRLLQGVELNEDNDPADRSFMRTLKDAEVIKSMDKKSAKEAMSFAAFVMKQEVKSRGRDALNLELPFDEAALLQDMVEPMKTQLGLTHVEIANAGNEDHPRGDAQKQAAAGPGKPQIVFYAVEPQLA